MYQLHIEEHEMQMLAKILDAAVRASGLNSVQSVSHWQQKLIGAIEQSKMVNKPLDETS